MERDNTLAPIILFVYNRYEHTRRTIESLQKNTLAKESNLYIFSDGAKNDLAKKKIEEVRSFLKTVDGFKNVTIVEREKNYGLARSIIEGVSSILKKYENVIVLEDDLITSKYFLDYMNRSLNTYEKRKNIWSVTGFSFSTQFMNFPKDYQEDIYLNIRPMSWSWATWKDRWETVDWDMNDYESFTHDTEKKRKFKTGGTDLPRMLKAQMNGRVDSWYVRWSYHAIIHNLLTVYPKISYVNNLGHDASGTHCNEDVDNVYGHTELNNVKIEKMNVDIEMNSSIVKQFNKGFNLNYYKYAKRKILSIFKYIKS